MNIQFNQGSAVLVTAREAAELLSVSDSALYRLVRGGQLESVNVGRSVRIPTDAILRFVESLKQEVSR